MGHHINKKGQFKSDKYKWCPAGFFALKFTDELACKVIISYAMKTHDKELSDDLMATVMKEQPHLSKTARMKQLAKMLEIESHLLASELRGHIDEDENKRAWEELRQLLQEME